MSIDFKRASDMFKPKAIWFAAFYLLVSCTPNVETVPKANESAKKPISPTADVVATKFTPDVLKISYGKDGAGSSSIVDVDPQCKLVTGHSVEGQKDLKNLSLLRSPLNPKSEIFRHPDQDTAILAPLNYLEQCKKLIAEGSAFKNSAEADKQLMGRKDLILKTFHKYENTWLYRGVDSNDTLKIVDGIIYTGIKLNYIDPHSRFVLIPRFPKGKYPAMELQNVAQPGVSSTPFFMVDGKLVGIFVGGERTYYIDDDIDQETRNKHLKKLFKLCPELRRLDKELLDLLSNGRLHIAAVELINPESIKEIEAKKSPDLPKNNFKKVK